MKDDSPGRCGLDSRIYQSSKDKRKFITVYGDNDKYLLYEEYIKRKKRKKYNRSEGNKQGKRYYIQWNTLKNHLYYGYTNKTLTSNYFLGFKQATECAYRILKTNPYMDVYIYEETNIDDEWVVTNKEFMFL